MQHSPMSDAEQLMHWADRLRLYAQVQGTYFDELRERGFDAEMAFALVRDWSSRTMHWAANGDQCPWGPALAFDAVPPHPASAPPAPAPSADDAYLIMPEAEATAASEDAEVHELRLREPRAGEQPPAPDAARVDERREDAA